jgi:hypothetical protein
MFLPQKYDLIRHKRLGGGLRICTDEHDVKWLTNGHVLLRRDLMRDWPEDAEPSPMPTGHEIPWVGDAAGYGQRVYWTEEARWFQPRFNHDKKRWDPQQPAVGFRVDGVERPCLFISTKYVELLWSWVGHKSFNGKDKSPDVELRWAGEEAAPWNHPLVVCARRSNMLEVVAVVMGMRHA